MVKNDRRCSSCGSEYQANAAFCNHCGAAVVSEPVKHCSYCGREALPTEMFCGDCGESLATAESPPVIAQEKQPSIESACPHCGERVSSEDLICGACGTPLKESS
ncbi:MAG TPA: zinc-ribbon domain-containing protein, partial [Tissierellia bacterium]|nr:zinc-ribbon domain-containing protein [Tissierellia bacterium]